MSGCRFLSTLLLFTGLLSADLVEAKDPRAMSRSLALQGDERRPDDQWRMHLFGRPLTIGGEIGFDSRARNNYTLDDDSARGRYDLGAKAELEVFYELSAGMSVFAEASVDYEREVDDQRDSSKREKRVRRGQSWLYWGSIGGSPWSLQVGRQQFRDKREWWWDELVDAVSVRFDGDAWRVQLAVGEDVARVSSEFEGINPRMKDVRHTIAKAEWTWARKNRLSWFVTHKKDESGAQAVGTQLDEIDEDPVDIDALWLGARARGRWKSDLLGRVYYWADVGYVQGEQRVAIYDGIGNDSSVVEESTEYEVEGWAYDVGLTFDRRKWPGKPRFTFGYAWADGDSDVSDGKFNGFVQTGMHDNNGKYRGVDRFKYYGEVLRPDLSNLSVITAGLGMPFARNSSVELLWHKYRQVEPSAVVTGARVRRRPNGFSGDIGEGIDLVIGIEEWRHVEIELIAGAFREGSAFGSHEGETAFYLVFSLDYNF